MIKYIDPKRNALFVLYFPHYHPVPLLFSHNNNQVYVYGQHLVQPARLKQESSFIRQQKHYNQ